MTIYDWELFNCVHEVKKSIYSDLESVRKRLIGALYGRYVQYLQISDLDFQKYCLQVLKAWGILCLILSLHLFCKTSPKHMLFKYILFKILS